MPRFYFTATDRRERVDDDTSVELTDDAAARAYAEQLARNLATSGSDWQGWDIEVRDEADQVIAVVPISPVYGA